MLSRNPFSLLSLASWLRTKSGPYRYMSHNTCLIYHYLTDMGEEPASIGPHSWRKRCDPYTYIPLSPEFAYIASGHFTTLLPDSTTLRLRGQTYEAALTRCEFLLERENSCSV